jgi:DNA-binding MarR family transcriptional regulator
VTDREEAMRALASELWILGRRIRRNHMALVHEVAPELGVNGYALFEALADEPDRRQSDLAEAIGTDKGALSRLVGELEALGLVERTPDPSDGRAQLVRLTDEGAKRMWRLLERRRDFFETRLDGWSAPDLEQLAAGLARYNAEIALPR